MESINLLLEKYNKLNESIKTEEDIKVKTQLQQELSNLTLAIQDELKKEHQRGNNSKEFIQLCSRFDAVTTMERSNDKNENIKNEPEINYTLASGKVISAYDGSEIDISNLSRIEKIKTIYDHTGVEINNQDPEVLKLCDLRFQEFLRGCNPATYQQKYGENWQKAVEQIYKSNYLETVQRCIANGLNEVDEKNRIREKSLSQELKESEKEIAQLTSEVNGLKEEIVQLNGTIEEIQIQRKGELESYKEVISSMTGITPSIQEEISTEEKPKSM